MATARSPLAGQDMNQPKPKGEGNVASVQQQEQAGIEKEKKEAAAVTPEQRQAQQQSGIGQAVEQVASKMGNFAHSLRARVNQLVSGAAQTTGFTQAKSEYVWDPKSQTSVLRVTEGGADIDSVVAEKKRQQELLKGTLSPFATEIAGKLKAKTFGQVVKEQMGEDPEVTRMLQMVTSMQDLESRGLVGSPEARALEAQLREADKFGMVTSLRNAMNEYNRLMGLGGGEEAKWYGDAGDTGYSALSLAGLGEDVIRTEVEKAKDFSSGLFGGDFEENLQKQYDIESLEGQRAARRAEQLHGELFEAFKTYVQQVDPEFQKERDAIKTKMKAASEAVRASMLLTAEGREALQWLDMLGGDEDEDVVSTLMTALSDPNSGLGKEQRDAIAQFIGKVGESTGGQLDIWLESLGKSGKIPFTDADGKTTMVEPTGDQKLQILNLMQDTNIPATEKSARLKEIVRNIGIDKTTGVGASVDAALDTAKKTGNMDVALTAFTASMAKSLQTFAYSRTEDAVRAALGVSIEEWDKKTLDQRADFIRETLKNNPDLIETIKKQVKDKQAVDQKMFEETVEQNKVKAEKSLSVLDSLYKKDEKGNVTGTLADNYTKLKNAPAMVATNILGHMRDIFVSWAPSIASQYESSIANNAWIKDGLARGVLPKTIVSDMAALFAYQDGIRNAQRYLPSYGRIILPELDITEMTMRNPAQIAYFRKYAEDKIAKYYPEGEVPPELTNKILGEINASRGRSGNPPSLQATITMLDQANVALTKTEAGIKLTEEQRKKVQEGLATMTEMAADMKIPVFNPDEVIQGIMGYSRGIEDILGGRLPEGVDPSKIKIEDLATLIPKLISGTDEKEPVESDIPPQVKAVLETLGLPMDAWSIQGGIPHIRMGDGKFIPVDSSTFTNIAANMMPSYATPEVDVNTNVARQELAGRTGGPDLSKMKLPPPPPPPKGSKVLSGKESRDADKLFKKGGGAQKPEYVGSTVSVKGADGRTWFQRITGAKTTSTGQKVLTLEVVSSTGGKVVVGEIPYVSNEDGNIAITGADGKAFVTNQSHLADAVAAIGASVVNGSYSAGGAAAALKALKSGTGTISADIGEYLRPAGNTKNTEAVREMNREIREGKSSVERTGASREFTPAERAYRESVA
jgi:hypothetical protein